MGPAIVQSIRRVTQLPLEIHLMISDPDFFSRTLPRLVPIRFRPLGGQPQSTPHGAADQGTGQARRGRHQPATGSGVLEEIIGDLDQVLVMTVNPGFGHQQFVRTNPAEDRPGV